jgi:hypothetical protein
MSIKLKKKESNGINGGRDSVLGITNRYGLDGPGIEFRCEAKFSVRLQKCPEAFQGMKGRSVVLNT